MKLYIVLLAEIVVFVGSCAVDSHLIAKRLPGSRVVEAQLNTPTPEGTVALAPPM